MSHTPPECPEPARLQGFMNGSLPAPDRHLVALHLETCATCRAQLDRPTAETAVLDRRGGEPEGDATFRQHADTQGPWPSGTVDCPSGRSEDATLPNEKPGAGVIALDFLAPSDRPGSLGRLGPYEILDRVGQGGMGVVLKAHEPRLNRIVAVKVLMPSLAGSALARRRFIREAQAAAAVSHDHVVTIHAVDEAGGLPYLVMQLVSGQSLQQKIDREGPLRLEDTLRIGMQVASGLAAAHAQGLVHRDIKPANILLENSVARVKITDFGLARAQDDASLTASGTIAGTPHFMSPEQARGEPVDCRTDLFSLGSVLYTMCTGQPPFRADSTVAVLRKVSDESPRPIHALKPDVPEWLEALIAKLMAKDPAARYQQSSEVAEVLARHLAELQQPQRPQQEKAASTVTLAPPPKPRRVVKLVAAIGSAAALAIGFLAWWSLHARDSERLATVQSAPAPAAPPRPAQPPRPKAETKAAPPIEATAKTEGNAEASKQIEAGDLALKAGNDADAIEHFSQAIRLDPASALALLRRARVYRRVEVENWAGAIADATAAIQIDPGNFAAYETRAYAYMRSGENRRAIADATEMLRLNPKDVSAYAHRGSAYNNLREWDHAIADFDKFLATYPNGAWPLCLRGMAHEGKGDLEHALADYNHAIESDGNTRPFWITRGRLRARMHDVDGGLADITEAIRISSELDKFTAYLARADFERSQSLLDPAIADYSEVIRRDRKRAESQDVGVLGNRGSLYLARGEVDRALADLDLAIRLGPQNGWNYLTRGLAHAHKSQWDRAIADFEAGSKLPGVDKWIAAACLAGRGECLAMAGRIEQAEAAFDESVRFDPSRFQHVLISRAWFIDRPRGDYDAALKKLDEAAKGGMILPFLYRGLIYTRTGIGDGALADFTELMKRVESRPDWFAMADYPCHWLALAIGRGEAYLLKGDLDRALAEAEQAVRFAPWSAEAGLLRAEVHARRGNSALAEGDRAAAAKLAPDPFMARPQPRPAGDEKAR